nr:hypothetical protein [Candidatus Dormibacteraeota bacterium]
AAAWRQQAAAVRQLESDVAGQVQRTLSESWQGEASQAFGGNWRSLSGKLHDLAAGYDRMAAGLEQAAGRSGGLNSLAAELVAEIETLLAALQGLQDLAAVTGLAGRAGAVLTRLEELLREVEAAWAEFLSWAVAMTLWFEHLLQTMPRVQPVTVPRPAWEIGARLGPGGAVIELQPSTGGADTGGAAARLRKGPPADAGSLWRWLLVLLAALAGHDAGVLARLIALATGDNDPKNNNSKNPADGEPAFGWPPNLGPPEEPPKNEKGEIDWAAWEARLRQKGITGDVAQRIANAKRGDAGAIEELHAAERLANAGYQVELLEPVENGGVSNPDIKIGAPNGASLGSGRSPLRVEVKSGNLTERSLRNALVRANRQIKSAEGTTDRTIVAQQRGYVLYDAAKAATSELDQAGVEAFVKDTFTPRQFRQIRFYEVVYRSGKMLKRTFIYRNADGSITGPITEILSSP